MKARFSSYRLPVDHLEQAAMKVAACSLLLVQKKDELAELLFQEAEAERRLIALLKDKNRKYIEVDRVRYILMSDGTLGRELVL